MTLTQPLALLTSVTYRHHRTPGYQRSRQTLIHTKPHFLLPHLLPHWLSCSSKLSTNSLQNSSITSMKFSSNKWSIVLSPYHTIYTQLVCLPFLDSVIVFSCFILYVATMPSLSMKLLTMQIARTVYLHRTNWASWDCYFWLGCQEYTISCLGLYTKQVAVVIGIPINYWTTWGDCPLHGWSSTCLCVTLVCFNVVIIFQFMVLFMFSQTLNSTHWINLFMFSQPLNSTYWANRQP